MTGPGGRLNPALLVGLALLAGLLLPALGAPWVAPYDPSQLSGRPFEEPSGRHLLGTNDIGQDILSEVIFGTRISLAVGVLAAALAGGIGTAVGLVAGYYRGATGAILMRLVDVVLVIPLVPLLILLAAYLGPSLAVLIAVIGCLIWARPARVIRAQTLSLAQRDYVLAAQAIGARSGQILRRHIAPGVLPLVLAQFVQATAQAILLEATLSFLGLGDPTQKSWGSVLFYAQARNAFLSGAWLWWVVPPGLGITAAVLGFALLGLGLEEVFNPQLRARRH